MSHVEAPPGRSLNIIALNPAHRDEKKVNLGSIVLVKPPAFKHTVQTATGKVRVTQPLSEVSRWPLPQ